MNLKISLSLYVYQNIANEKNKIIDIKVIDKHENVNGIYSAYYMSLQNVSQNMITPILQISLSLSLLIAYDDIQHA